MRCDACDCSFPVSSFRQHQSGKQHLRNISPNGHPVPRPPRQPSPSLSHSASSNIQSPPPQATPPPSLGHPPVRAADPPVTVSHEGGLDFFVEGTGPATHPAFPSINHTLSIEITGVRSALSVVSVSLSPPSGSWYDIFGDFL
jgi:hypothetical protein